MQLKKIFVKNLFGNYDRTIEFSQKENLTILIGPNGCGKTTLLKMLNYVFNCEHMSLKKIDFEYLEIFIDEQILKIQKSKKEIISADQIIVLKTGLEYYFDDEKVGDTFNKSTPTLSTFLNYLPYFRRLPRNGILHIEDNKIYTNDDVEELLNKYYDELPEEIRKEFDFVPEIIREKLNISVNLISTNRLTTIKSIDYPYPQPKAEFLPQSYCQSGVLSEKQWLL